MKRYTSPILTLLISAALATTAGTSAHAVTSSSKKSASKKKTLASTHSSASSKSSKKVVQADARTKKTIAAAKEAAKLKASDSAVGLKDPDSLYNPANTAYLSNSSQSHSSWLFDFGPKSSDIKYDKRMIMAAEIAAERAHKHSTMRCWAYVKNALVSANVISSRPTTGYAKEAGEELVNKYGFEKLPITDPYQAPLGSVLVYGGKGAGHVEIRTEQGFVSDFTNTHPSRRPLLGVFVKPS